MFLNFASTFQILFSQWNWNTLIFSRTYQPNPVRIVDRDVKSLRNKKIPVVKVEWSQSPDGEFTWELESDMKEHYPHLF
jgi:hypothetical protein